MQLLKCSCCDSAISKFLYVCIGSAALSSVVPHQVSRVFPRQPTSGNITCLLQGAGVDLLRLAIQSTPSSGLMLGRRRIKGISLVVYGICSAMRRSLSQAVASGWWRPATLLLGRQY